METESLARSTLWRGRRTSPVVRSWQSSNPAVLASLQGLAGQRVNGNKAPNPGPTRRLTLSSKDNILRSPRGHHQRLHFYPTSAPHNLPSLLKRVSLSHRLLVLFVTTAHSHAKPLFLESSKIALTLEPFASFFRKVPNGVGVTPLFSSLKNSGLTPTPFGTFWKNSQTARE